MLQDTVGLEEFGVSAELGFLSSTPPKFSDSYYSPWDTLIENLAIRISSGSIDQDVKRLPCLATKNLTAVNEWRRAYVVLAFLVHGYVWQADPPRRLIPPSLSEPFLSVCDHLEIEPVVTYSGLCLWNWVAQTPIQSSQDINLANLRTCASFTGTHDEDVFYLVPDLIEADGGSLPSLLLHALAAAQADDSATVLHALHKTSITFERMTARFAELTNEACNPSVFYNRIRPFLSGSHGNESRGLPNGFEYQLSNGKLVNAQVVGGSAVQSPLFPFLDIVFGVNHASPTFQEMKAYMPGQYRRFLDAVAALPLNMRTIVEKHGQHDPELTRAFDECMEKMREWRGKHINIVTRYIVLPSKKANAVAAAAASGTENGEVTSDDKGAEDMQGTGGSALMPFLKGARDETVSLDK